MDETKEKSFERKNELLEAALEEFTAKNYDDASLNTIIKNAGISKGTFYYHFKDKEALYLLLLDSASKAKWYFMKKRMEERALDFNNKSIFERFKLQALMGVEFASEHPKYYKLAQMFMKEKGNRIYEIAKKELGITTEGILEEMILAAIENGDFREGFSKDFIVKVVSFMFTHFDEIFYEEEDFELEKMLENLNSYVDFVKNGLGNSQHIDKGEMQNENQ